MTAQTWGEIANWFIAATGLSLAGGTGAALWSYYRNGVFPGQELNSDGTPVHEPSTTGAWIRIVVGVVIAVWGLVGMMLGRLIWF